MGFNIGEMLSQAERESLAAELAQLEEDETLAEEYNYDQYLKEHDPINASRIYPENPEDQFGVKVGKDEKEEEDTFSSRRITDEDIEAAAPKYYPKEKVYRSLLLEIFTVEQAMEIEKIQRTFTITNNQKISLYREKLDEWGKEYSPLGGGTNRWAGMVDGYVIKIACDDDGKIDNKREFIYSIPLQPYVIKCYETYADGLIAVFEYVEIFTIDDFWKNTIRMGEILTDIATDFMIGDVGINSTNYVNWGFRDDGSIVILDYAYIYSVKFKQFQCQCSPSSVLYYDKEFNNLICNTCGKKYSFRDIRKRISRKDQEEEIGDIREKGYILTQTEESKPFNPKFVHGAYARIYSKIKKERKKSGESMFKFGRRHVNNNDPAPETFEEFEDRLAAGYYDNALEQYKIKEENQNG